jgi:hypothetical protein
MVVLVMAKPKMFLDLLSIRLKYTQSKIYIQTDTQVFDKMKIVLVLNIQVPYLSHFSCLSDIKIVNYTSSNLSQ